MTMMMKKMKMSDGHEGQVQLKDGAHDHIEMHWGQVCSHVTDTSKIVH